MNSERGINRRAASNDRMCDTNVSIGDVKAIPLNVVQAIIGLHARHWLPIPIKTYRLERAPRCELRGQVRSGGVFRKAEHTPRTSKNMKLHQLHSLHDRRRKRLYIVV